MIGLEYKDNFMAQIQERWMKRSYNLEFRIMELENSSPKSFPHPIRSLAQKLEAQGPQT